MDEMLSMLMYFWMEDLRKIRKILHCCSEDQKISA